MQTPTTPSTWASAERLSDVHWPDRLADWLADGGWLIPHGGQAPQGVPSPAQ
jgi:hypothetical protein